MFSKLFLTRITSTANSARCRLCLRVCWCRVVRVNVSVSITHCRDKTAQPTELPFGGTRACGCKEPWTRRGCICAPSGEYYI